MERNLTSYFNSEDLSDIILTNLASDKAQYKYILPNESVGATKSFWQQLQTCSTNYSKTMTTNSLLKYSFFLDSFQYKIPKHI